MGGDVLRFERRPGAEVVQLICRACEGEWFVFEDTTDSTFPRLVHSPKARRSIDG
jgi:hypothetical protein